MTKFKRKWIKFSREEEKHVKTLDKFNDVNVVIEVDKNGSPNRI